MGKQALLSHCNGKKNKDNDMIVKLFFQPRELKLILEKAVETDTASDTSESSESLLTHSKPCSSKMQASLKLVVTNSEKTKTEILWALKVIRAGCSNKVALIMVRCFKLCFQTAKLSSLFKWVQST